MKDSTYKTFGFHTDLGSIGNDMHIGIPFFIPAAD
jgi:hypothetical protein